MTKYIVRFSKSDGVKFVSHLDTMRVFARTMRRMGVKISHSQGFNPHPLMTFAHPMGVGMSSAGEYVEISLDDAISAKEFATGMNEALPGGFKVTAAKTSNIKSPFKALTYAEYEIILKGNICKKPEEIMNMPQILMDKKTKSGIKETDIKPMILSVKTVKEAKNAVLLRAVLKCGGENLKPELMIEAMQRYLGIEIDDFLIHRTRLLDDKVEELIKF